MNMSFEQQMAAMTSEIEDALRGYLPPSGEKEGVVAEAMGYSLLNGGKRLRPLILLAACQSFGGAAADGMAHAAAMEMIHTYSLIHDDLPAMDNDDYRRGKESCHKKYNEAYAILAGDGLLNLAFETMNAAAVAALDNGERLRRVIIATDIIGRAAGMKGMILGQAADIYWEKKTPDEAALIYINERKTGALLAASFEAGAVLGGAAEAAAQRYRAAGLKIGIAFQLRDDLLDQEGDFESMGKLAGSDQKQGKTTYLDILGKEGCEERIQTLTQEATALLAEAGGEGSFLTELAQRLVRRMQ